MSAAKNHRFDVRPILARGEEPFAEIRAKADALVAGESLTIIAPFLPAPLVELLKSEGFEAAVERHPDGAWAVNFRKP